MNRTMRGRVERTLTSSLYTMEDDEILRVYAMIKPCDNCYVRNCKALSNQYYDAMDCYNSIYNFVKEDNNIVHK